MARPKRLEYAGACYHVINRGNYRRDLFNGKGAAEAFERVLCEACERFGWRLHAYVIMRNHFHLALETPEPNLSVGMKWLQGTWVSRYNRFRGYTGRPFQGRFKSPHVQPASSALAQVAHYIHLNPVRARILPAEQLTRFRWSSLHHFLQKRRPRFFAAETILAESGGLADTPAGWKRYVDYLGFLAEETGKRKSERFRKLSQGWAIGTKEFKESLKKKLQHRHGLLDGLRFAGLERESWQEEREALWEQRLKIGAKHFGVDLRKLPSSKSALEKVRLAAWLKRTTAVSNGWLARRLDMGATVSVSQFLRRFRLAGHEDEKRFKTALSIVTT